MGIEWLIGKRCTGVTMRDATSYTFTFGEAQLVAATLWRIRTDGQLRLTSLDHGQQYGLPGVIDAAREAMDLLAGRSVVSGNVIEWSGDVLIVFDGDRTLQLLTDSTGYEAWELRGPGVHVIAAAGGDVSDFSG